MALTSRGTGRCSKPLFKKAGGSAPWRPVSPVPFPGGLLLGDASPVRAIPVVERVPNGSQRPLAPDRRLVLAQENLERPRNFQFTLNQYNIGPLRAREGFAPDRAWHPRGRGGTQRGSRDAGAERDSSSTSLRASTGLVNHWSTPSSPSETPASACSRPLTPNSFTWLKLGSSRIV